MIFFLDFSGEKKKKSSLLWLTVMESIFTLLTNTTKSTPVVSMAGYLTAVTAAVSRILSLPRM